MRNCTDEEDICSIQDGKDYPEGNQLKGYKRRVYTGERPYQCNQCDKSYSNSYLLSTHMMIHNGERPYECSYCDKAFSMKSNLSLHIRTHAGKGPYQCSYCDKVFSQKSKLKYHVGIHSVHGPYNCSYCNKAFSHKGNLTKHMRLHTGEKTKHPAYAVMITAAIKALKERSGSSRQAIYKYILANYEVGDAAKAKVRAKLVIRKMVTAKKIAQVKGISGSFKLTKEDTFSDPKKVAKKTYQCRQCDKTFSRNSDLIIHMKLHAGDMSYQCSQCDKAFSWKDSLTNHMGIHTKEKPYQCSDCDKTFSRNNNLIIHMRIHTGERPYQCRQCNKTFLRKCDLTIHMRIHTGERPYQCSLCNGVFSRNSDLTSHLRVHGIHNREKPNQCSDSDKSFLKNSLLTEHMTHNFEGHYECKPSSINASGAFQIPSIYIKSETSILQDPKDHNLENILVDVSDMCFGTNLFEENYFKASEKSDTDNLSITKDEVKEDQMHSEYSVTGNLTEPKVEVKEEQMDGENLII